MSVIIDYDDRDVVVGYGYIMAYRKKIKKIKLLLVHRTEGQSTTPHLGILALAAYIREKCPGVVIRVIEEADPLDKIVRWRPEIVGITAYPLDYQRAKELAVAIRKRIKTKIILGGVLITADPEALSPVFDMGVVGEGEVTLEELVNLFRVKNDFKVTDLEKIDGLAFYKNGKLIKTKRRELIKDIDSLPIPARDLLPMENYLADQINLFGAKRTMVMMTSRGCPYRCVYCGSPVHWGSIRFFSVKRVMAEIEEIIKRYQADSVVFADDNFIVPKSRLLELVAEIRKKGWQKQVLFSGFGRANLMDEEIVRALKSINVRKLAFGFESMSPRMLAYLKAKSVKVADNIRAIRLCQKYGIAVSSGFIVSVPGETVRDLKLTYQALKKYPIENPHIYILAPYQGTEVWRMAESEHLVNRAMDMKKMFYSIPLSSWLMFWKKDKLDFLGDKIFLNQKMRNDADYQKMLVKLNAWVWWLEHRYYLKQLFLEPRLIGLIAKKGWRQFKSLFDN